MIRKSYSLLYLIGGSLFLNAANVAEPCRYTCVEVVCSNDFEECDAINYQFQCSKNSNEIDDIIATSETAADVIQAIARVMLKSQLAPFGFEQSLSLEEMRSLTHEQIAATEYGKLTQLSKVQMSVLLNEMPPLVRHIFACYLFQPMSPHSDDARSMTLGEMFDLGCECALELHEATTGHFANFSTQKIAAIWGFYVPSLVYMRWMLDDISEEQVREIVAVQKQVLQRFTLVALPHLYEMWVRFEPIAPEIREALHEPVSSLIFDLQQTAMELGQHYESALHEEQENDALRTADYDVVEISEETAEEQTIEKSTEDVAQK